jgi:hypothetical protein
MLKRYPARLALIAIVVAMCAACSSDGSPTEPSGIGTTPTDFSGQYLGSYKVTACSADPLFSGFCDGFPAGTTLPITLSLTQSQKDVTGTVSLGSLNGTFTGTVSGGVLTATAVMNDLQADGGGGGTTVKVTLESWSTTITGSTLTGGFQVVFRVPSFSGNATLTATIEQLIR